MIRFANLPAVLLDESGSGRLVETTDLGEAILWAVQALFHIRSLLSILSAVAAKHIVVLRELEGMLPPWEVLVLELEDQRR